jgi:hypothetical protein
MTTCPKCAYVRTTADTNPEWQCPRCHVAYAKFAPPAAAPLRARIAAGTREMASEARHDHSLLALIASNLFALLIAFFSGMKLRDLLVVYAMQGLIIGVMHAIRILSLTRFQAENFRMGDRPMRETMGDKLKVAVFLLLHYGGFHVVALGLLLHGKPPGGSALGYLACGLVFALNHAYSMLHNVRNDARGRPSIAVMMFLPYARVLPMHVTVVIGAGAYHTPGLFLTFAGLKILADAVMHVVEHYVLSHTRRPSDAPAAGDAHSQR